MILACWVWMMVADAPLAPKKKVEYKPVLLQNGVEFRPSHTGFAFVKNGKVLKQYTYQELGGVPESPVCQEPTVKDFGNGTVEGPVSAGGYVGCYFTDEGEKKWCAVGPFTDLPGVDSLGRYFVGFSHMWPDDPIYVFTPEKRLVLEGRGLFDADDVTFMDSGIVFGFWDLPIEVVEQYVSRHGKLGSNVVEEVLVLVFRQKGLFVADTFVTILPGYRVHRAVAEENRVRVWMHDSNKKRHAGPVEIHLTLRPWEGDTLKIPQVR